jgi:RND family efflux transporter MFP subunit
MSYVRVLIGIALALLAIPPAAIGDQEVSADGIDLPAEDALAGKTAPVQVAIISSVQSGLIERLAVKEGDRVSRGQVLVELASDLQRAALAISKSKAESQIEVRAAETRLEEAQRRYDKMKDLIGEAAASRDEFEEATSRLILAKRELETAQFEIAQALRQYDYDEIRLRERTLISPIDGYVVERFKHPGEAVDEIEPLLHVVQVDPLVVQVECPLEKHGKIEVGDKAQVNVEVDEQSSREGTVTFLSKLGNPGSHTFRMKLEVPNPKHDWIAGMKVWVSLPQRQVARRDSRANQGVLTVQESR